MHGKSSPTTKLYKRLEILLDITLWAWQTTFAGDEEEESDLCLLGIYLLNWPLHPFRRPCHTTHIMDLQFNIDSE